MAELLFKPEWYHNFNPMLMLKIIVREFRTYNSGSNHMSKSDEPIAQGQFEITRLLHDYSLNCTTQSPITY